MRAHMCLGAILLAAGCGSTATVSVERAAETGSAASCAAVSPAQQFALARRVFIGVMLAGPTASFGGGRVLSSPARMRVERYLKGHGPRTVTVDTAVTINRNGTAVGEDGIDPHAGQRWKIYTSSRHQPFATSICGGSRQVTSTPGPTGNSTAPLALWRAFPVDANPRPIVPLGEGMVLDPRAGFRTVSQKLAYLEGRFVVRAPLPASVGTIGRFDIVPAAVAYRRLRAAGQPGPEKVAPLVITRVRLGGAMFLTDRGSMRLPAWKFFFKGVSDGVSVLAVGAPEAFVEPPLHRFGPPGPGNSIEDSATMSASGTAITISFIGAHAGTGPCDANYTASAAGNRVAVAFTVTTIARPVAPHAQTICAAVGYTRTATLHLARPLGARVLISAADAGAIPVTPVR